MLTSAHSTETRIVLRRANLAFPSFSAAISSDHVRALLLYFRLLERIDQVLATTRNSNKFNEFNDEENLPFPRIHRFCQGTQHFVDFRNALQYFHGSFVGKQRTLPHEELARQESWILRVM
jgi:hypothetical protein